MLLNAGLFASVSVLVPVLPTLRIIRKLNCTVKIAITSQKISLVANKKRGIALNRAARIFRRRNSKLYKNLSCVPVALNQADDFVPQSNYE